MTGLEFQLGLQLETGFKDWDRKWIRVLGIWDFFFLSSIIEFWDFGDLGFKILGNFGD